MQIFTSFVVVSLVVECLFLFSKIWISPLEVLLIMLKFSSCYCIIFLLDVFSDDFDTGKYSLKVKSEAPAGVVSRIYLSQ